MNFTCVTGCVSCLLMFAGRSIWVYVGIVVVVVVIVPVGSQLIMRCQNCQTRLVSLLLLRIIDENERTEPIRLGARLHRRTPLEESIVQHNMGLMNENKYSVHLGLPVCKGYCSISHIHRKIHFVVRPTNIFGF